MNTSLFLIFSVLVVSASAFPNLKHHRAVLPKRSGIFAEEDPSPVRNVTTCGGFIDASSAEINFNAGGSIRADQHCVWVVRTAYDRLRFVLKSSGLNNENDGIFITNYASSRPGGQFQVSSVGQNYSIESGTVLITLAVGHAPTRGFSLELYASGFASDSVPFSRYEGLTAASGNYSYPITETNYGNYENTIFVVNPAAPKQVTLSFLEVAVENSSGCIYDYILTWNWFNNEYIQLARFCGTTIPTPATLEAGLGLVTFVTDSSVVASGFKFQWL